MLPGYGSPALGTLDLKTRWQATSAQLRHARALDRAARQQLALKRPVHRGVRVNVIKLAGIDRELRVLTVGARRARHVGDHLCHGVLALL